jgi:hypothetical protein
MMTPTAAEMEHVCLSSSLGSSTSHHITLLGTPDSDLAIDWKGGRDRLGEIQDNFFVSFGPTKDGGNANR